MFAGGRDPAGAGLHPPRAVDHRHPPQPQRTRWHGLPLSFTGSQVGISVFLHHKIIWRGQGGIK